MTFPKFVLLSGAITLTIVALLYGADPFGFSTHLFGVTVTNNNDAMLLRGIMGLLFGTSAYYFLGFLREKHRSGALLTMAFFLYGLVFGRLICFIFDGAVSPIFYLFVVAELAWAINATIAYRQIQKAKS